MTERKRWDKQHAPRLGGGAIGSANGSADAKTAADPVLTKQRQYIKILEERNRVKKRLAAASKSQQRQERLQEREEAFVTAFNVPARAAATSAHPTEATRKTKSAATLLPTRMEHHAAPSRSAPGNTLNFASGRSEEHEAEKHPRARRAKWSRPQAPMSVAVQHHDGVPRFHLTCVEDDENKVADRLEGEEERGLPLGDTGPSEAGGDDQDDEDDYLEESFEDFEEDEDELRGRQRTTLSPSQAKELVLEEIDVDDMEAQNDADEARNNCVASPTELEAPGSPTDFSQTTKELVGMIQHLSRTKQRALVDVLQKFQSSDQHESDVKELRSSIGDPDIWKQITSTLGSTEPSSSDLPLRKTKSVSKENPQKVAERRDTVVGSRPGEPSVAPLKQLLEEQLRWEDEYAHEMKERLAVEREEKQRAMREAEARRAKMIEQMEEEERELERLMEAKRHARLAKLRALEQEMESEDAEGTSAGTALSMRDSSETKVEGADRVVARAVSEPGLKEAPAVDTVDHYVSEVDELLFLADAKCASLVDPPDDDGDPRTDEKQATAKQALAVPRLKLPSQSDASQPVEIGVTLLSTWGQTRAVGLTQICAYGHNGEELEVDLSSLHLYEHTHGKALPDTSEMVRGLKKLFNGVAHTNTEKDMWLGRFADSGVLRIGFKVASAPSKLCIWNYNSVRNPRIGHCYNMICYATGATLGLLKLVRVSCHVVFDKKLCTACARDIEVLVRGKCMWSGSLPETFGDKDDNSCTWVDLLSTGRNTSRTARHGSENTSSTSQSVCASYSTHHDDEDSEVTSSKKAAGGAPMWLAGSRTSASTARLPLTNQHLTDSAVWAADAKHSYSNSSQTNRRRNSNSSRSLGDAWSDTVDSKTLFGQGDTKSHLNHAVNGGHGEKSRPQHKVTAPNYASLSSWDSLENFSKTNRSRLPQPTNDKKEAPRSVDHGGYAQMEVKPSGSAVQQRVTTSTLLMELRSSTTETGNISMSRTSASPQTQTGLESAHPLPAFPSAQTPSGRSVGGDMDVNGEIPVLPSGRWLRIEILSTWGDPHYVGLNGVELFDHRGELITFRDADKQVTASPESINVLEENSDDPRVPKNLVDGTNFTCDDLHMWLAPFTPGASHHVLLQLGGRVALSMVRIWNYNKSRTHTCRGVRGARLVFYDSLPTHTTSRTSSEEANFAAAGTVVFEGEIRQAPGVVGEAAMNASNEVILFTQEPSILKAIEANDVIVRILALEEQREEEEARMIEESVQSAMALKRPRTSDNGSRAVECSPKNQEKHDVGVPQLGVGTDGRPLTTATRAVPTSSCIGIRTSIDSWVAEEPQERSPVLSKVAENAMEKESGEKGSEGAENEHQLMRGRRLTLQLISTWGDRNYVGLTQIQVLVGSCGTPLPLDVSNCDATPRDLVSLGYSGDPRTLDKLVDGEGVTCDDTHMWLVPLHTSGVPEIRIDLKQTQFVYGIRVWNYNKSADDSSRGVKQLRVALDGDAISPEETGFLVRKAPGTAHFDYGQLIRFSMVAEHPGGYNDYLACVHYPFQALAYKTPLVRQDYEAPLYPQGFLLKVVCWTTWGDPFYLGLNGLELYDFRGARITETPAVVTAVPYSVAELLDAGGDCQSDARVPENLMSGRDKNTWEAHDAWLAPLASSLGNPCGNVIYVAFDTPVVLSMVKFWNYSKTAERGVKDLDIYLDDLLVFSGTLRRAPPSGGTYTGSSKVHRATEQFGQPILFSSNQAQVDTEKWKVVYCGAEEQDVLTINEGQVMHESRGMYRNSHPGAEGVVVDLERRPTTAVCRQ